MPRARPPSPPEFRERILELVRAGGTREEPAEEYGPSAAAIHHGIVAVASAATGQWLD